jgi:nucleotide-binding universal stress UspA family protein
MATEDPGRTLLVGYDGSPFSVAALRWAGRQAGSRGRVIAALATESAPSQLEARWQEVLRRDDQAAAQQLFEGIDAGAFPAGCTWEAEVVEGDSTAEALVAAARRHRADAIVVGSHGHGPLQALLGSVSHKLLEISPVAVVVLGPRAVPGADAS